MACSQSLLLFPTPPHPSFLLLHVVSSGSEAGALHQQQPGGLVCISSCPASLALLTSLSGSAKVAQSHSSSSVFCLWGPSCVASLSCWDCCAAEKEMLGTPGSTVALNPEPPLVLMPPPLFCCCPSEQLSYRVYWGLLRGPAQLCTVAFLGLAFQAF